MLSDFLEEHRAAIVERARVRVAARRVPLASAVELSSGVPLFLSQLVDLLRDERLGIEAAPVLTSDERAHAALGVDADDRGAEMLREGLTIAQVVEGYGDVCQAITEQAIALRVGFGPDEYRTLNLCLDVATSRAVTAFAGGRERSASRANTEKLGALAHELRNQLGAASLAYDSLRRGLVGFDSRTGALLGRSLLGLRDLVDRALTEVRLAAQVYHPERFSLAPLIEQIEVGATIEAKQRQVALDIPPIDCDLLVVADRALLASAVANLVQNAMKFTRPAGRVLISVREANERVLIEVTDQCGGLPPGAAEVLFQPFESAGADRTGLGLGLKISLDAVRASGGSIAARDLPGEGCVFTIDLPAARA